MLKTALAIALLSLTVTRLDGTRISRQQIDATVARSMQQAGIPALSLDGDGNYFLIHHTPADTVDKIDPLDVAHSAAGIAVMSYVIAEMPERIR